jgi:DNA polymerase III alpha subunit
MGVPIKDINASHVGKNISVGGVISKIHKIYLKTQKTMLFVTIEDTENSMEILVFPKVLDVTGAIWEEDKVILASGKISDKDGNFKILCDSVKAVNQSEVENFMRVLATQKANGDKLGTDKSIISADKKEDGPRKIIITLPNSANQDSLKKLSQYFNRCEVGSAKIYLSINNSKLETPYCINQSENLENNLKTIIPEATIEIL